MEKLYPKGPESVSENLTKPTSKYKLQAWMALGGLCTFVLLYFWLIYLFATTSWRSFQHVGKGNDTLMNIVLGIIMAFLALFMVKALFFVKRFNKSDDIEITAEQEPELFSFINEVADNTGAPRPHRVYLSPRVNASVFYDLSIVNLIFPTKKNLEIGLGLVNSLSLNEFKAILAHEFGHFAQKTMAIGRWVYISRQIASHIVGARDWFDNFIRGLSNVDIRIAWVGWIIGICVWCIRSLMDTLFTIVVLAERALSREMEFNADLVAVSVSGSDAIVTGLYKLEAADSAWEQSIEYGLKALHEGKSVADVFNLQKYLVKKIGVALDNPDFGNPPVIENSPDHRIFKKHLAAPPKMWSTHPSGFEREENAKRIYVHAPQDERSSWILFKDSEELKRRMTKHLFKDVDVKDKQPVEISNENVLLEIDKEYNKVFYDPQYRGFYLKQSLTRDVNSIEDLYSIQLNDAEISEKIKCLYPESLKPQLESYESKNEEFVMLQALHDKQWDAPGGVILHEGKELTRKDLPVVISQLKSELKDQQHTLLEFNKSLRSLHVKLAERNSSLWVSYLKGLAELIHYAEHTIAVLIDKKKVFNNTLQIVLADGKVSSSEMSRLLNTANDVTRALESVYSNTSNVHPGPAVLERMHAGNWSSLLEEFKLGYATQDNINGWIAAVDSWINLAVNRLGMLKDSALEELILTEEKLVTGYVHSSNLGLPPASARISYDYPRLLSGSESILQNKLGLRDRFFAADGLIPAAARFSVAASIIGVALFAGRSITKEDLIIYNGLSIPVAVEVAGEHITVDPMSYEKVSLAEDENYAVESRTEDGSLIEKFNSVPDGESGAYIYNIASAAVIQKWTIYYTSNSSSSHEPQQYIYGAPRWFKSRADYFFTEPPETIQIKGSFEVRSVLTAYSEEPSATLSFARDRSDSLSLIRSHALWDDGKSKHILHWLTFASAMKNGDTLLASRLERQKNEVITLRSMQEVVSKEHAKKACRLCEEKYSKEPENGDLYYLAKRCMEDGPEQDNAFIEGYKKWPDNPWLSFAAGYALTNRENWELAETALRNAIEKEPSLTNACVDVARIYRLTHDSLVTNVWNSDYLNYISQMESHASTDSTSLSYINLSKGKLEDALLASNHNMATNSYILRLAAASDGASNEIIEKSLKLKPHEGMNMSSISPTIGLLARKGRDIKPYMDLLQTYMSRDFNTFAAFFNALHNGVTPDKAESIIKGLSIQTKGYAYVLGSVYLDKQCPKSWKEKASRILFMNERPNFIY